MLEALAAGPHAGHVAPVPVPEPGMPVPLLLYGALHQAPFKSLLLLSLLLLLASSA